MDNSKTVVLMVLHSMPQAKIIKGLLDAHDIRCFLSSEYDAMLSPFFSMDSSVKLYVLQEDYKMAKAILSGSRDL